MNAATRPRLVTNASEDMDLASQLADQGFDVQARNFTERVLS